MCAFRYPTKRYVAHSKNYAVSAKAAHEVTFSEPPPQQNLIKKEHTNSSACRNKL